MLLLLDFCLMFFFSVGFFYDCGVVIRYMLWFFFFKQKTAYEMRISDWSSDVCSSDLSLVRQEADGKWYVVNTKWGPSRGWFQIRPLDEPAKWPFPDSLRIAAKLGDPRYNARVAFEIWKKDGN